MPGFTRPWLLATIGAAALLLVGATGPATAGSTASEMPAAATPVEVAQVWFAALMGAKVEPAMAVSQTPFSWDCKTLHDKREDLEAAYKQVAEKKGARDIKPTSVRQLEGEEAKKVLARAYLGKEADVVAVLIDIEGEGVVVFLKPGKMPKVVGFSD